MRSLLLIISFFIGLTSTECQTDILFENDFNDSSLLDANTGLSGVFSGMLSSSTTCGIDGTGLNLDGTKFIQYPVELNEVLDTSEFSLSFYLRPDNRDSDIPQVVFSHRKSAARDSSFAVHYYGNTSEIVVEFAEDNSSINELVAELDPNQCWYYITIVKTEDINEIYVGSTKEDEFTFSRPFSFGESATFKIADSPLIGNDYLRYTGVIDEVIIRNGTLQSIQLASLNYNADQIISRDTTIFNGETVDIKVGATCAANVQWTPSISLNDPMALMPIASPDVTTVYSVDFNYDNCTFTDSIRIGVVGDDVSCQNLILPKAFTPNGDNLNDNYGISSAFLIEELISFEIFDKWGSKIFSTSFKEDMWDGTFNGRTLDPGMFLYKIRYICEGQESINTGAFSLIN